MKISGIYKIQSIHNPERIYVGSAVNISQRWYVHLNDLRKDKHSSKKLQRHYNKYGESDLTFSILLGCEKDELVKKEQYFIDSYNPYFNSCIIAGSPLGFKHTKESRIKMGISRLGNKNSVGRKASPETLIKLSIAHSGKKFPNRKKRIQTEETKRKISEAKKGVPMKEDTKFKLSISHKGKKLTDEHKHNMSLSHIGSKRSDITKDKMRKAQLGKKHSAETKIKMKNKWKERKSLSIA